MSKRSNAASSVVVTALTQDTTSVPIPEAERVVSALGQLQQRLQETGDLPAAVRTDVQRAVDELTAETAVLQQLIRACDHESARLGRGDALAQHRTHAVQRLTDIGSAADDFLRQVDQPEPMPAQADSLDRLQAARQAFRSASREVR